MCPPRRISLLIAAAGLTGGLLAPVVPAAQAALEERGGRFVDAMGDAPVPAQDLVEGRVTTDPFEGRFTGSITVAAKPTAATNAEFVVYYGTFTDGTCNAPVSVDGRTDGRKAARTARAAVSTTDAFAIVAGTPDAAPGASAPSARAQQHTFSFSISSAQAKGMVFDCFFVRLRVGDAVADEAGADDLTRLSAPSLIVRVPDVRLPRAGARGVLRVAIENIGGSTARNVRIALTAPRGVRLSQRSIVVPRIRPDAKVSVPVRVRMSRAGSRDVKVVVRAGQERELSSGEVQVAPKPPPATGSLAGKFLWGTTIGGFRGWDNHGIYVVSKRFAYRGFPRGGLPTCRRRTASPSGEGCVPYWYDKRTGRVQVDHQRGTFRKGALKFDNDTYALPMVAARANERYALNLGFVDSSFCPGPGCTTFSGSFVLRANGTYALGGAPGRYQVLRGGRVRLTPAGGGRVRVATLVLGTTKGRPTPASKGLFLDSRYYYRT